MVNGVALVLEIKLICHLSFIFVFTQNGIFKSGEFLFLLIAAGLFIIFYFLDTCKKQHSMQFPFADSRDSVFFNRES